MRDKGAITIAQDSESSVVHGMAAKPSPWGGVTYVLPTGKIAAALVSLVNNRSNKARN